MSTAEKMRPCRCPSCRTELEITCPRGCENAELGATAEPDPISRTRAPKAEEKPRRKPGPRAPKPGSTREKVLAAITARPAKTYDLVERLGIPLNRVSFEIVQLVRGGFVVGRIPPGKVRGMVYYLAGAA